MIHYRKEVMMMNQPVSTERAIRNAAASVEMEGFTVTDYSKDLCRKLLNKEITKAEYIRFILDFQRGKNHAV